MIVDTGVFVAAANDSEPDHPACAELLAEATGALVVPAMVIAEATFMIERAGGPAAEALFLRSLRSPTYVIEAPSAEDLLRASELVEEYADLPLGGTDASIVAMPSVPAAGRRLIAEREGSAFPVESFSPDEIDTAMQQKVKYTPPGG